MNRHQEATIRKAAIEALSIVRGRIYEVLSHLDDDYDEHDGLVGDEAYLAQRALQRLLELLRHVEDDAATAATCPTCGRVHGESRLATGVRSHAGLILRVDCRIQRELARTYPAEAESRIALANALETLAKQIEAGCVP